MGKTAMTPIREIRKRYTTDYALALEMGITPAQLKRFLGRDAFFNIHTGEFFQVAKTKANIGLYEGNK